MQTSLRGLREYLNTGKPMFCELDENPYYCEFWALDELEPFNAEYQVPEYASGYFGFASSGGGEMFAISPTGSVVCLPFIGMEPKAAIEIAPTWAVFESQLRSPL